MTPREAAPGAGVRPKPGFRDKTDEIRGRAGAKTGREGPISSADGDEIGSNRARTSVGTRTPPAFVLRV